MHKPAIKLMLLWVGLMSSGYAAAGGRGTPGSAPPPVILSTVVDQKENALIISGRNFGNASPVVKLADRILTVKRSSENQVVADLPPGIQPATYGLTVSTSGHYRTTSDMFSVMLFAAADK